MSETQVQQHPASCDVYIRHGWSLVPIPPGTKGPRREGWNLKDNSIKSQSDLPYLYGIGLAHAYSGTMALDVDHWDRAAFELMTQGIDLKGLYEAPDAVIIDSGREGRGKLLYAMPFGLVLPSHKLMDTDTKGKRYNYLDFRCGTHNGLTMQDVLPPSIHPDTNQPYRWSGNGHWSRLPTIPFNLLTFWESLINKGNQYTIQASSSVKVSLNEVIQAVDCINPDVSREEWITVGMALHHMGSQTNDDAGAFTIWDEWSKGSETKYPGSRQIRAQWLSFKTNKTCIVTLGSLFHLASEYGWKREILDVSGLFDDLITIDKSFETTEPPPPDSIFEAIDGNDLRKPREPVLNLDLFPPVLATRAKEVSVSVGCDPLIPLFAGLAATCGVVNAESRLELMHGFRVPPILWLMTIGEPADKKSPGSRPMFAPLHVLEDEQRPEYAKALTEWEGKEAMYATTKKAFLEFAASPESLLDPDSAPQVYELPPQPVPLKITVSDITSQKLVRNASERPRGLLCYLDEMNAWVKKITDKSSGEDRSAWVSAYEGEPYDMDRVGSGSIHCTNLAVAIFGNIQPRVHAQYANHLSADGLLQRFIPGVVNPNATRLGHPIPDFLTTSTKWEQALRVAYSMPQLIYKLNHAGHHTYREFQAWYEEEKRNERILNAPDDFMTAFGKIEGLTGRIALVFHMLENPMSQVVSEELLKRVIRLVKSYIIPSLKLSLCVDENETFDKWVANFVIVTPESQVTLNQIKRAARYRLQHKSPMQQREMITNAMDILEHSQWVKRVTEEKDHRVTWAINPMVKEKFSEKIEKVRKARNRA